MYLEIWYGRNKIEGVMKEMFQEDIYVDKGKAKITTH